MSFIIKGAGTFINTSMAGNIQPVVNSFIPTDLGSKLTLWLDEREQTTTILGGNPYINFWGDQQTLTGPHDMSDTGGYVGPLPGKTINGYAAPEFKRATLINPTRMQSSGSATPLWHMEDIITATSYHVFAVVNIADIQTDSPNGQANEGIIQGGNGWYPLCYRNNSGNPQLTVGHYSDTTPTGFRTLTVSGLPLNTDVLLETWFDGSNIQACIANGSVSSLSAGNVGITLSTDLLYLGTGNGYNVSASLGSLIICDQALDEADRASVRQYLGTKYGVTY